MNDPMIIAGAIVLVLASLGGVIVQVINAMSAAAERRDARTSRLKLEELAEAADIKSDKIIEQGVQIHTLTNSNLSKVTSDLATAISKIEGLEDIVRAQRKNKEIADNLARTAGTVATETAKLGIEISEKIEDNTEDTVIAVKDLKGKK